jgi:hypothetical protein
MTHRTCYIPICAAAAAAASGGGSGGGCGGETFFLPFVPVMKFREKFIFREKPYLSLNKQVINIELFVKSFSLYKI